MQTKPLNIVYLHAHDAGRFVEPYGHPVATPNLMRFAREATLFRKAFSVAPTCGPSRSGMLSGQYPHEVGMYGLPGPQGWRFDDYGKHLAHTLGAAGYQTVLAGCQHEAGKSEPELLELGYSRLLNTSSPKGIQHSETIQLAELFLAEDHQAPFFLSVGIAEPHRNNIGREHLRIGSESARFSQTRYYDPDRLDSRYTAPPPWLPDLPEIRKDMASYAEGVKIMDEYMGRVLHAIDHYGYRENTLVIVTTDHGIEFPGGKKTLNDAGIGVMLMIRGPGGFSGGKVIEPIVSQLDIYPTVCELLNLEPKPWLRGKSLLPLVNGETETLHDEIFAEQTYHGRFEPLRCIRTERYKYIRRHFPTGPIMPHDGPSTPVMEAVGHYHRETGREELYDLYLDPMEACNRVDSAEYREIHDDLSRRLDRWLEETGDPFPSGEFPPIPNA